MTPSIGFTGTRKGMTDLQKESVRSVLGWFPRCYSASHGMAIGADAEFHAIFRSVYGIHAHITGYPCNIDSQRADNLHCDTVWAPLPPLQRNRLIVDGSDVLIACPAETEEQLRSGTWSTVRYARKTNRPVFLVYPSGEILTERWHDS